MFGLSGFGPWCWPLGRSECVRVVGFQAAGSSGLRAIVRVLAQLAQRFRSESPGPPGAPGPAGYLVYEQLFALAPAQLGLASDS